MKIIPHKTILHMKTTPQRTIPNEIQKISRERPQKHLYSGHPAIADIPQEPQVPATDSFHRTTPWHSGKTLLVTMVLQPS